MSDWWIAARDISLTGSSAAASGRGLVEPVAEVDASGVGKEVFYKYHIHIYKK